MRKRRPQVTSRTESARVTRPGTGGSRRGMWGVGTIAVGLLGCSLLIQSPTVRVVNVQVTSLGLTQGTAEVGLRLVNPNGYGVRIQELVYRLDVEESGGWLQLAADSLTRSVEVAGKDSAEVSLSVPFRYQALSSALWALLQDGEVTYRLMGDVQVRGPVGTFRIPFESRERLRP